MDQRTIIKSQDINQQFKEREIEKRAKQQGIPYVNLINIPMNADLAQVFEKEKSTEAQAIPFIKNGKRLRLAVVDPESESLKLLIKELESRGYQITLNLCSEESLKSAQKIYSENHYIKHETPENKIDEQNLGNVSEEIQNLEDLKEKIESASYDVALNYIQVGGFKTGCSDIHFQPEKERVQVRFRIDGVLRPVFQLSHHIYDGILKEMKQLAKLKLNVTNIPQDGQYSFRIGEREINVRVALLPSHYGETSVMRLLNSEKMFKNISELGFQGTSLENLQKTINLPHGMILITGPTGSGKTTTMYSALRSIDTEKRKIITLENPIEYNLEGVTQSQVDPEVGYDFSSGLRAILRQDPDVIMVGEIRDLETAEMAVQASLTGHLVMSTLHTNSAIESIPRLVNMGVKRYILASALDLIIAQRLVRTLCPDCKKEKSISEVQQKEIQEILDQLKSRGIDAPSIPSKLYEPAGCESCSHSGFKGQTAISEVLEFDDKLREMVLENKSIHEITDYAQKEARMLTLKEDGILKVIEGGTTLEEVARVTQ